MVDQLLPITIPFLTAFLNVVTVALGIGMLPALWILLRAGHSMRLLRWALVTAAVITAAVYGLPLAHVAWKTSFPLKFKPVAMYLGYFIGLLFAPMALAEPLRIVRLSLRNAPPEQPEMKVRRVRHKRRKDRFSDLNLR
jgi:hypothetical protein